MDSTTSGRLGGRPRAAERVVFPGASGDLSIGTRVALTRRREMRRTVARNEQGAVYVDYLILVAIVGLPTCAALVFLGLQLLDAYQYAQRILTAPIA